MRPKSNGSWQSEASSDSTVADFRSAIAQTRRRSYDFANGSAGMARQACHDRSVEFHRRDYGQFQMKKSQQIKKAAGEASRFCSSDHRLRRGPRWLRRMRCDKLGLWPKRTSDLKPSKSSRSRRPFASKQNRARRFLSRRSRPQSKGRPFDSAPKRNEARLLGQQHPDRALLSR